MRGWMGKAGVACALSSVLLFGCGLSVAPNEAKTDEVQERTDTVAVEVEDGGESFATESFADAEAMAPTDTFGFYEQPAPDSTEEYSSIEESGYVAVATTPLSTVSADVDTASYANLRRMLRDGYVTRETARTQVDEDKVDPDELEWIKEMYGDDYLDVLMDQAKAIPTGAVRIEEMLNYFDYDYATPKGDDPFEISAQLGPCPWNDETELLTLGFASAPEADDVREAGVNLVLLIDVSGSMDDPDKLPLLQSSLADLVDSLGEDDVVSIVTYSGEEAVVLEGAKGSEHVKIMRAVRSLEAEGSTNGEAGLKMAYEVAARHFIKGGVNRIVMCSDGDLNVGMTSESDLHDFVEEKRAEGTYLSVLGFGAGNYKDNKMETLADHGNGSYHYIDSEEEAKRVFGDKLMANLVPFASDVKLQVEFNPATVKGYRLIGYENRTMAAEDFLDDEKDAGEVGPSAQFTVCYEIVRPDSKIDIPVPELKYDQSAEKKGAEADELLTASLRYKDYAADNKVVQQEKVVKTSDLTDDPGEDWRMAAAVSEFGMLLRESEFAGSSSYDDIRTLVGKTDDELRQGFLELVDLAEHNR